MRPPLIYWVRVPLLLMWSVLLSGFTAILGAAPLRVLRMITGGNFYWLLSVAAFYTMCAVQWYPLAAIFGLQVLLVGTYSEFEERGCPIRQAAGFAISLTALFALSCFYIWTAVVGKGWVGLIANSISEVFAQINAIRSGSLGDLKPQDIMFQIPSIGVVVMMLSLALALMLEKGLARWAGIKVARREKLNDFSTPDFFIWLFIVGLLGAFARLGDRNVEMVAMNILNVCVTIYFLQGLAILGKYFATFRLSFFWRMAWIFLAVFQLPMLLSLVGLVDYWVDFRRGFVKKAAQLKNKKVQE